TRRGFLGWMAAAGTSMLFPSFGFGASQEKSIHTRSIPSTGERVPAIGLGSWITFNVGFDPVARDTCAQVMDHFFKAGGRMIDSSPMYGSSREVIGYGLEKLNRTSQVFSADKVWTAFDSEGPSQIEESLKEWNVPRFDLLQVHNLLSWKAHLKTLFARKKAGRLGYVGITTSHGRRHDEFERIMHTRPLDFVQITYNVLDREAEQRLLPLAKDRGMAVIINRPFRQSQLIDYVKRHPLPEWASEIDCENWAQILLKFIISHPAVTCAIPATRQVNHVVENMGALHGRLPDEKFRKRIIAHVEDL
ncbi:MAG: aldo/keto reductase, partial [Thermodesulfobacteriota bacterium]